MLLHYLLTLWPALHRLLTLRLLSLPLPSTLTHASLRGYRTEYVQIDAAHCHVSYDWLVVSEPTAPATLYLLLFANIYLPVLYDCICIAASSWLFVTAAAEALIRQYVAAASTVTCLLPFWGRPPYPFF